MKGNHYLPYFADAWDVFVRRLEASNYTSPEFEDYLHTGGVSYGETWDHSFTLVTPKGNEARKCLQVHITRTTDGLYEAVCYIL